MDPGERTASGSRLTQEQWASLQEHLAGCAQCRAYAQQMQTLERDVSRALQSRLGYAGGPQGTFRAVVDRRKLRKMWRERLLKLLYAAGVVAALAAFLLVRREFFPAKPTPSQTPTLAESPTQTPVSTPRGSFRGILAFESSHEGNAEIYLLNAGPTQTDLTNLTNSPAQDTFPTWSPDGEWIAFLSDRSGQNEVYVLSIAGSRLTQLTADPNLDWLGPLSWSPGGQTIAARAARRDQGGDVYIYLVPLNGRALLRSVAYSRNAAFPRNAAFSRNAAGAPLFSPTANNLAFLAAVPPGLLYDTSLDNGWHANFNTGDLSANRMRANDIYDWAQGGSSLVYISEGPYSSAAEQALPGATSQVNISPMLSEPGITTPVSIAPRVVASAPGLGAFRAAAWAPDSLVVVYAQDADKDGCWTLKLQQAYLSLQVPVEVAGLCLEGSLSRSSWQPVEQLVDESSLVVLARRAGERAAGFLALRIPSALEMDSPSTLTLPSEWVSVPGLSFSEDPAAWPGDPLPRPVGRRLGINPIERPKAGAKPGEQVPSTEISARVVVARVSAAGDTLARLTLDGRARELVGADQYPSCPTLSPDGSALAYRFRPSGAAGEMQVAVMPSNGGEALRLTGQGSATPALPGADSFPPYFGCPVWSPDGTMLAAEYRAGSWAYLALISANDSAGASFVRIEPLTVPPVWTAREGGNGALLLVYPEEPGLPLRVVSLDPGSEPNQEAFFFNRMADTQVLVELPDLDAVSAFAAAPDGSQIALVGIVYATGQTTLVRSAALLYGDPAALKRSALPDYDLNQAGSRGLAWLGGGKIGLYRPSRMYTGDLNRVELYDVQAGLLGTVASFVDLTTGAAWSPDARWVFVSSESGLWAQDVQCALLVTPDCAPARVLADWVTEVDFR